MSAVLAMAIPLSVLLHEYGHAAVGSRYTMPYLLCSKTKVAVVVPSRSASQLVALAGPGAATLFGLGLLAVAPILPYPLHVAAVLAGLPFTIHVCQATALAPDGIRIAG